MPATLLPPTDVRRWVLDPVRGIHVATPAALMGILNATPDSFSDGGSHRDPAHAAVTAAAMVAAGATWLDVGGESTRPGAAPVCAADEIARVVPIITAVRTSGARISIDTRKGAVARAALSAGATMVNDVSAGADPDLLAAVAAAGCPLVLMHMQGDPTTMQRAPTYRDVVDDVLAVLHERMAVAVRAGVREDALVLDPGIGFGKTVAHNLALLQALPRLSAETGRPLLVGISRKSFLAQVTGSDASPAQRDAASHLVHAALAAHCAMLRVHDVAGAAQALRMSAALRGEEVR